MKNPWLWNLLSIVALVVGLAVLVLLPWYGVLAIAVAIATPAEGPSFGTAPAGTWMCTSWAANQPGSSCSETARERTHEKAVCADSCITSES